MKYGRWNACLAAAAMLPAAVMPVTAQAQSETGHDLRIAPGPLTIALQALSKQTGIAVGGTDPALSRLRTAGANGHMTVADALRRLLLGTGYRARRISTNVYRIERTPVRAAPTRTERPLHTVAPEPIVVSASKSDTDLSDYLGAVQIISANELGGAAIPPLLENVLAAFPQTAGTALGAGRDKIFVRGIADSSFNGPTQSTISLYLGEQRLIYSAPNPALGLYDMDKAELIEGPQGTLYGAGALGGVIRLSPKEPDPSAWQGRIWSSAAITQHGDPSFEGAGMINAPLSDRTAMRLLAYGGREGGYVDDRERAFTDVNRSRTSGFRVILRSDLPENWTVSASAFGQRRRTRDGQYIDPTYAGITRESLIAQPFANDLIGGNLTFHGHLGALRLVSTTGVIDNNLDTRFDSSILAGEGAVQAYDEARRIRLITHETRLSSPGNGDAFSWVAGISFLSNRDDYTQLVTSLNGDSPPPFADIRYRIREYALFGEGTLRPARQWSMTLGGRLVATESHSVRLFGDNMAEDSDNPPLRFLPMAALGWRPETHTLFYARYQHGYRTGGVTVERAEDGTPIPTQFRADKMQSAELGMRTRLSGPFDADLSLAAFYVRWTRIQGDLVQAEGFPITRNLGNGRIFGLTASARVRFDPVWHAKLAAFFNHNRIDRLTPSQTINRRTLPNVADFGANASLGADVPLPSGRSLNLAASLRYVGTSYLDIDPTSQVRQGDYVDTALSASMTAGAWDLSLALDNVLDTRGNRFAFGNPFAVRLAPQATPLRPRTLRLSASMGF